MISNAIKITPVTPTIGAEVEGIDLARPLDDATFETLHGAWMEHQVLFFRDQHLDSALRRVQGRVEMLVTE